MLIIRGIVWWLVMLVWGPVFLLMVMLLGPTSVVLDAFFSRQNERCFKAVDKVMRWQMGKKMKLDNWANGKPSWGEYVP